MATRIAAATQNAAADAIAALANGGSVEIRTGYQPSTADDTATGTLLATVPLNGLAFADAVDGVAACDTTGLTVSAVADGTAGWFRALTSGSAPILDGSVSATGGGGDMQLTNIEVANGQDLVVNSWNIEMPAG